MNKLLEDFEAKLDFHIPFLKLYVDDSSSALPEDKIDFCLNILNSLDEKIKFTHEVEVDGCLPFLDLLLVRGDDKILIDLYSKPISSNRFLNFISHHPLQQKISIVN